MPAGVQQTESIELQVGDLSPQRFLVLAAESLQSAGCEISRVSLHDLLAYDNSGVGRMSELYLSVQDKSAILRSTLVSGESLDFGSHRQLMENVRDKIEELRLLKNPEELDGAFILLLKSHDSGAPLSTSMHALSFTSRFGGFRALLFPKGSFFVTPILIWLNVFVYLAMVLGGTDWLLPQSADLMAWGANFRPLTLNGEWWRLLTCCFVHIGILHLVFNMYALFYIGSILEAILGRAAFLTAYLLTGIVASLFSLAWHEYVVSAGASGAIFGMYGVFLALLTSDLIEKSVRKPLLSSIGVFVLYNLLYGMRSGVDNAAHIGGLLSGLITGFALLSAIRSGTEKTIRVVLLMLSLFVMVSAVAAMYYIPNHWKTYEQMMEKIGAREREAISVMEHREASQKLFMKTIRKKGIANWYANIRDLDKMQTLSLPEHVHRRNELLRSYYTLRMRSYETVYNALNHPDRDYDDRLHQLDAEAERVAALLNTENR